MNCQRIKRMLSAWQDGELAAARREKAERHLRGCASCRAHWQGLQAVQRRLRRLPPPAVDPVFPARVMSALRPVPRRRWRLLPAAVHAAVFIAIFLAGFILQTLNNGFSAEPEASATYSAVLLESRDLGLMAVQNDTLMILAGERP